MNDLLGMRVAHCVGDLPHQVHPCINAQFGAVSFEIVVKPDCVRIVIKNQCRAQLRFDIVNRTENTRVIDIPKQLELPLRGALKVLAVFFRKPRLVRKQVDAPPNLLKSWMRSHPILVGGAIRQ